MTESPSLRRRVELHAGPLLVLLARLPRIVPFLLVFGLLLGGLFAEGTVGGVLLLVLAVLLSTLLFLGWPALTPGAKVLRSAVLGLVVVRAATFLT